MPPSGCYFSRDNKNYRLSGLENNRSNGLPLDRGLHSLRLDTQAVAAPRCSLPPLFFFLPLPSSYPTVRVLLLFVALFFAVSVSPSSPVVTLSGPSTPFDAPEGPLPLFRVTVPPRNIFVASCLPARLPRDSLSTSSPSLHRTATTGRPLPLYILHIINYQPYSRTHSLPLPSPPYVAPDLVPVEPSDGPLRCLRSRSKSMDLSNKRFESI